MPEQETISAFYEQDHDRLDELFKTFQTFKRSDFDKAKEAFQEFSVGLQRHIVWEEDLLFPSGKRKPACPKADRRSSCGRSTAKSERSLQPSM